jgi:hypothetical protein
MFAIVVLSGNAQMQNVPGGKAKVSVNLSKNVCKYGYWDRAISLYSSKTVDKKEIFRTIYNTGIYCSSNKVGTVYLV